MRTSYSALETFKTCPIKYKYQEIDKIKGKKSKEQVFGTAIHRALQFMFRRDPVFPTLDRVLDFFGSTWAEARKTLEIPDEQKDFYLEQGRSLLKKFFLKNQPWNFNVIDLESRFEVVIDDPDKGESHILVGIIDRIDKPQEGEYEIIDYKTSRRMPSQEMVDKNLQLSIYNMGLLKRWPHLEGAKVRLSLYFLEHGEKISSARAPEALEATKRQVLETIHEIEGRMTKNDFPPTPGPWCDWCPYRPICPMWRHLYTKPETPSDEQIKEVLKEYFQLRGEKSGAEDKIKMLQQKIHQYLDEKKLDRVFGDEGYITRAVREKPVYDLEKAREILERFGKWQEVLKADETKLQKIIKTLPYPAQKELEGTIKELKRTVTFLARAKTFGEEEEKDEDAP